MNRMNQRGQLDIFCANQVDIGNEIIASEVDGVSVVQSCKIYECIVRMNQVKFCERQAACPQSALETLACTPLVKKPCTK